MRGAWDWQRGGRGGAAEADGWGRAREGGPSSASRRERRPGDWKSARQRGSGWSQSQRSSCEGRGRLSLPLLRALSDACLHKQAACVHVVHWILNTAKPTADLVGECNTRNDARRAARGLSIRACLGVRVYWEPDSERENIGS